MLWLTAYKDIAKPSINLYILFSTKQQDLSNFNQFLYFLDYNNNQQGEEEDEFKQYIKIKSVIIKPGELIDICR